MADTTTGSNVHIPGASGAGVPNRDDAPPLPEYELTSYEPVEFSMPPLEVSDEQVEKKMLQYAEQFGADYIPTNRKVVGPKEHLKIDVEITKDGELVKNVSSDDRLYSLGEGLMPIDFDRNVLGMKVGETREFDFVAPDLDDAEGAEATFHASVTVNKVMKKTIPQITDAWVERYMPVYKNAEDFREQVRKGIEGEADRMIEQEKNQRAAYELASRFEGKIDDYWYEATRADLRASYEQQAKGQGMDLEDFLGKQGIDENTFSMMLLFQTREMLTQGFALDAWARHYGIEATDEDVEEFAQMMAPAGRSAELIAGLKEDENQREAFRVAARRYVANKDLTAKAKITIDKNAQ